MRPKGTIYQSGKSELSGEIKLALSTFVRFVYYLLRGVGAGLIGFGVIGALFTYGPVIKEEIIYSLKGVNRDTPSYPLIDPAEAQRVIEVQKQAGLWQVNSSFSIVIPKIDASANIVANVDPANESEYLEALKEGVAHAKGTYFPGQGKSIYLFSHSTDSPVNIARYNAVFYLLRKLEKGDRITVFFADKIYEYEVQEELVTSPNDTSWITDIKAGERLVLQTCDPPGTTWNRLLVIATPI